MHSSPLLETDKVFTTAVLGRVETTRTIIINDLDGVKIFIPGLSTGESAKTG